MTGFILGNSDLRARHDQIVNRRKNIANMAMQIAAEEEALQTLRSAFELEKRTAEDRADKIALPVGFTDKVITHRIKVRNVLVTNQKPNISFTNTNKTLSVTLKGSDDANAFSDRTGPYIMYFLAEFDLLTNQEEEVRGLLSFPMCLGSAHNVDVLVPMVSLVKGLEKGKNMLGKTADCAYAMAPETLQAEEYTAISPATKTYSVTGVDLKLYNQYYLLTYDQISSVLAELDYNKYLTISQHDLDAAGTLTYLLKYISSAEDDIADSNKWKDMFPSAEAAPKASFPTGVKTTAIETGFCVPVSWRSAKQLSKKEIQDMRDARSKSIEETPSSQTSPSISPSISSSRATETRPTPAPTVAETAQCSFCGTRVSRWHDCQGCRSHVCPAHAYEYTRTSDGVVTHWCNNCFGTPRFNEYSRGNIATTTTEF